MDIKELEKLDNERRELIWKADECARVRIIVEEMKDTEYVQKLLTNEYCRLKNSIDECHDKMFPKKNRLK